MPVHCFTSISRDAADDAFRLPKSSFDATKEELICFHPKLYPILDPIKEITFG